MRSHAMAVFIVAGCMALASCSPRDTPKERVAQREVVLTVGTPVRLPDGVELEVQKPSYAHLGSGDNASACTLVVRHEGETQQHVLRRLHSQPVDFIDVHGWRVALDYAKTEVALLVEPRPR